MKLIKKLILFKLVFFSLLIIGERIYAQAKFGDNPEILNPAAVLELESTNKGFLPPRLSLARTTDAFPFGGHILGMMVYNLATVNDVTPGIYINDGKKWGRFQVIDPNASSTIVQNISNRNHYPPFDFDGATTPKYLPRAHYKMIFETEVLDTPSFGTWNSASTEFTVIRPGLYTIRVSVRALQNAPNNGAMTYTLHAGGSRAVLPADPFNILAPAGHQELGVETNGSLVVKLNANDKIYVDGFAQSGWYQTHSFINISYSGY